MKAFAPLVVLLLAACGGGGGGADQASMSVHDQLQAQADAMMAQLQSGAIQIPAPDANGRMTIQVVDSSCGGMDCGGEDGSTAGGSGAAGSGGANGAGGYGGMGWDAGCSTSLYAGWQTCCAALWGGGRICYLVKDPRAPYAVAPGSSSGR